MHIPNLNMCLHFEDAGITAAQDYGLSSHFNPDTLMNIPRQHFE
jgi:hypothetical protein